jgi:hypothetical protein
MCGTRITSTTRLFAAADGQAGAAAAAGLCALLMFYTRLNHLLFAAFLPAFLLPLSVNCTPASILAGIRRVSVYSIVVYVSFGSSHSPPTKWP